MFEEYGGSLGRMAKQPLGKLRVQFLKVNGVGPETADSILLYAFDKPVFVVDAYTKRLLYRHRMIPHNAGYDEVQRIFMGQLKPRLQVFNEYHALIVALGKKFCKTKPRCHDCPLNNCNYSLVYKCAYCHKALLNPEDRHIVKHRRKLNIGGRSFFPYVCRQCHFFK